MQNLKNDLKDKIKNWQTVNAKRHYFEIAADDLYSVAEYFHKERGFRFSIASGVDNIRNIEMLYHFSNDRTGELFTARVYADRARPEMPTLTKLFSAARWIERETYELLGVNFKGNDDLRHLLLDESWPKETYPLRKDYKYGRSELPAETVSCSLPPRPKGGKRIVPIGPFHPLQEEPEFFELEVEGEKVTGLNIHLGYNHRGIEKLSEGKHWDQVTFLVERICGICSCSHPYAYVNAVEDLLNLEIPDRAKYIRSIIAELERIHSHLLWLGLAGHFVGYNTVWMWAWKYRETVLDIAEQISGNRNHYAMMRIGGVRRDIFNSEIKQMKEYLLKLVPIINMFENIVKDDPILRSRLEKAGPLSYDEAVDYCVLGPTARASGIKTDIRKIDVMNGAYHLVDWNVPVEYAGDVFAKTIVRLLEMKESVKIIEQCFDALSAMKEGAIWAEVREIPAGEGIGRYEAPRGEVFHYIKSDGGNMPVRHKIRAPSFMNVASNEVAAVGGTIADAALTLAAVDPCYCCTERMQAVNGVGKLVYDWEDLIKMSQDKTKRLREKQNLK